jgi:hypothetical protein
MYIFVVSKVSNDYSSASLVSASLVRILKKFNYSWNWEFLKYDLFCEYIMKVAIALFCSVYSCYFNSKYGLLECKLSECKFGKKFEKFKYLGVC